MRKSVWAKFYRGIVFLAILMFGHFNVSAQQTAADFFKITLNALKYKDYCNTIVFATKAIALNPKLGGAYWDRAIAYDCKGEYRMAINDYDSAMNYYANNTDLATLRKNRGMVYNDIKLYDSAISDFDKSLVMNPGYGLAYWNRGIAYDFQGSLDSAINDYTRALQQFTSAFDMCQLHLLRGLAYMKQNKTEKAANEFKEILRIDTSDDYHTAYAKLVLQNKDSAKNVIRIFIIRARGDNEKYKNAYFDAARLFAIMDNHEKAIGCLEMSFDLGYKNFRNVETDRDFDNITSDANFSDLVNRYKEKDKNDCETASKDPNKKQ